MKCPECNEENDVKATYCNHCSYQLKVAKGKKDKLIADKEGKKHTIFISHADGDKTIVEKFCKMLDNILCTCLHPADYKIFRSSETGCIECGKDGNHEVHAKLHICKNMFCILTAKSYKRPWILYEIGYLKGKSSKKNFMPIAIGIEKKKIINQGLPYSRFQIYECDDAHLSELMIIFLNKIIPNHCNGREENLKKSFAPHINEFLTESNNIFQI